MGQELSKLLEVPEIKMTQVLIRLDEVVKRRVFFSFSTYAHGRVAFFDGDIIHAIRLDDSLKLLPGIYEVQAEVRCWRSGGYGPHLFKVVSVKQLSVDLDDFERILSQFVFDACDCIFPAREPMRQFNPICECDSGSVVGHGHVFAAVSNDIKASVSSHGYFVLGK